MSSIGILLLAAGSSSRMGRSKQLLSIGNESLIARSAKIALAIKDGIALVVLGSGEEEHRKAIGDLPLKFVHNKDWEKGMGSSIKAGLNHLLNTNPKLQAVLVMVCDQPLLTAAHLETIIKAYKKENKSIVASFYSNQAGVPALFDQKIFPELLQLADSQGAKKVIEKYKESLAVVEFEDGANDLDTPNDYETFKQKFKSL